MSTNPPLSPNIVITLAGPQISNQKHSNLNDDYLRFITSQTGQYLASISVRRQLTLFDLNNVSQFRTWSQQSVSYMTFSQKQDKIAVITRSPSIKFFQIKLSADQKTKSINLIKEVKSQTLTTTYGWIVWSLDNKYIFYVKNQDLVAIDVNTFEEFSLSNDSTIKTKCLPTYLVIDRSTRQLVSASRNGQICTYSIEIPSISSNISPTQSSKPSAKILQSTKLSSNPITISDLNQGKEFLTATTTSITQNKQTFYSTYIISKSNQNLFWRIKLQQQLISPPLMMQADNIENYIVGFLKGERSLYVYDIGQVINQVNSLSLITSDDSGSDNIRTISHKHKIQMPYLLHSVNYNKAINSLVLGITGANNYDKIIQMDFMFNCSSIAKIQSNTTQVKQLCTQECSAVSNNSYFSFLQGKCKAKNVQLSNMEGICLAKGKSFQWSKVSEECGLKCDKIVKSVSRLAYGWPQECMCDQNYVWSSVKGQCQLLNSNASVINNTTTNSTVKNQTTNSNIQNKTTTNPTNPNKPVDPQKITPVKPVNPQPTIKNESINTKNQTTPISPAIPPNNNQTADQTNTKNNSVPIVLSILTVLLLIGIGVLIYVYKKKKWCFKQNSYVQDNQLKQSDIRSSQQLPNEKNSSKSSQPSTHQNRQSVIEIYGNKNSCNLSKQSGNISNKSIKMITPEIQSPEKQFNMNDKINQPIDQFVIEQIISESNENDQNDYKVDSQRKFN